MLCMDKNIITNNLKNNNIASVIEAYELEIKTIKAEMENVKLQNKLLEAENEENKILINYLNELIKLNKIDKFGTKSEKTPNLEIFNEAERTLEENKKHKYPVKEYTIEEIEKYYELKKQKKQLEEQIQEYTLPKDKQICPDCGKPLYEMGEKTHTEIVVIPAKVYKRTTKNKVYGCKNCEKTSYKVQKIESDAPTPLIEGSLASPEIVAFISIEKYLKGVPLYRLSKALANDGICISRQTMSNWVISCATNFLVLIYNLLKATFLTQDIGHADETVVQVLNEKDKKATTNSYMWLFRTGIHTDKPVIIFEYNSSREHEVAKRFLADFQGFIHADGYEAYHNLNDNITVVGCWAHARRKFVDALKNIPPDKRKGCFTEKCFLLINELFSLEREFIEMKPEERYIKRQKLGLPIVDELFSLVKTIVLDKTPKSTFKTAITYLLNQEVYLRNVFLDGRLELSNNLAERTIKPFVIGRKNWLFCVSETGADSSSIIYSLVETAKANGISPYKYIEYLLKNVPNTNMSELSSLLPWNDSVKRACSKAYL